MLGQKLDGKKQTPINKKKEIKKAVSKGLPTPNSDGVLRMTMFQVNAGEDLLSTLGYRRLLKAWITDGAGPFKCEVSPNGNGDLVPAEVIKDVPGTKGRSNAKKQAFPFEVKVPRCVTPLQKELELTNLPSNLKCTGPGGSCTLRCKNTINQPFGGCVVFKASAGKKRSLFGRLAVEEDPEAIDTNDFETFDSSDHIDEVEENLEELN